MFRIWVLCAWVLKPWECLLKICFKRISDSKVAQILTFFILLIKWGASTYDKAWTVDRNSHFWSVLKVISNVTLFPKHRYFTFPLPLKLSAFLTCLECVLNVIFQLLSKQAIIHVQGGVEIILYLFQLLVCVGLLFWFLLGRISQNPPRSILILEKLAFKKEKGESSCSESAEIILILCKVIVCTAVFYWLDLEFLCFLRCCCWEKSPS